MPALLPTVRKLHDSALTLARPLDGIPALLLRLILAPVMLQAGYDKLAHFEDTAAWFGNPDWGLGLPLPELMTALAGGTELVGGALLLVGLATRWVSIPLMFTMLMAIFLVHWENGWLAISDASSWLANERVLAAAEQKERAIALLQEHGDYAWLTRNGSVTLLNNGIEFAAIYFAMLAVLFFHGGGRYVSLDHWLARLRGARSAG